MPFKVNYRADIDGLRCFAVWAVVLYHTNHIIPSGFLGVDVFFVISGFLITSLILREFEKTGNISFSNFYYRRARRILPNFYLISIFSIIVFYFFLTSSEYIDLAQSVIANNFFMSNFLFWKEDSYFSPSNDFKPLIHTWSLAVEEQYYIVIPFVIFLLIKILKLNYKLVLFFFAILILFSFFIRVYEHKLIIPRFEAYSWLVSHKSIGSFFLPFGRIWELMLGSSLAFFAKKKNLIIKSKFHNSLSLFGLTIIFLCFFIDKDLINSRGAGGEGISDASFKNFLTLSVTLATCLVIYFTKKKTLSYSLLANKTVVFLGLTSYSTYLWHQPLLVLVRTIFIELNLIIILIYIFILLIVSTAAWHFLEKPVRCRLILKDYKSFIFFVIFMLFFSTLSSFYILKMRGFETSNNFYSQYLPNLSFNNEAAGKQTEKFLVDNKGKYISPPFDYNKTNVLFIGNSHSMDFYNTFYLNKDKFDRYSFSRFMIQIQCFDKKNYKKSNYVDYPNYSLCKDRLNELLESKIFKETNVIFASTEWFLEDIYAIEQLKMFSDKYNKKLVISSQAPIYPSNHFLFKSVNRIYKKNGHINVEEVNKASYNQFDEMYYILNKLIKEQTEKYAIPLMSKYDFQCNSNLKVCYHLTDSGFAAHYDRAHYTLEGAKFFGERIYNLKLFDNIFLNSK
jgi:peptidoglycan/LPS O-acetylase OafA/YrhL